jgi:predicted DNA-binding transcriptional regulator YafY
MNKQTRLIYLLNILSRPEGTAAAELAERCKVCERTIYRDIGDIALAGFPVMHDHGYRILNVAAAPPGNFTFGELEILGQIVGSALPTSDQANEMALLGIQAKVERAIFQFPSRVCLKGA